MAEKSESQTANTDRGLFDCFGKKEEKPMPESQEHEPGLVEKLPRSNSSSSSSSEEEVEEDGVKIRRKKKKGLTEKIKEKMSGHHKDEPPVVAPAQCAAGGDCVGAGAGADAAHEHKEKKGILEMIKEKLPGAHKDDDEAKKAN